MKLVEQSPPSVPLSYFPEKELMHPTSKINVPTKNKIIKSIQDIAWQKFKEELAKQ